MQSLTSEPPQDQIYLEKQIRARELRDSMVEKFAVDPADFQVLETINLELNSEEFTVAYAAASGLRMGNWRKIFDRPRDPAFTVNVGNEQFDTRNGMTLRVYQALVSRALTSGLCQLPDSPSTRKDADRVATRTLLTGEPPRGAHKYVLDACVATNFGMIRTEYNRPTINGEEVRFRPAVRIR